MEQCNCINVTEELYNSILRPIEKTANKGTNGTLSIVAGSECYRGAACLSVGGAMKTGVGIVRLVSVERAVECTASRFPSATFLPVKPNADGMQEHTDFLRRLGVISEKSRAVLCGCGLGIGADTERIVGDILDIELPNVIDADGLNLLAKNMEWLKKRNAPTVITPHVGEMSRLCGKSISEIKSDRKRAAEELAKKYGITVVLKDDITHISSPDGVSYICALGNEGLAKGGSGDVLAGMISGFLAQGYSAEESAVLGCALHGIKAMEAARVLGVREMRPENLIF